MMVWTVLMKSKKAIILIGDESTFQVTFSGIPPFAFTYTRQRYMNHKHQEDVFSVDDIQGNIVNLIDRVTSIKDKYCSFPRRLASIQGANVVLSDKSE